MAVPAQYKKTKEPISKYEDYIVKVNSNPSKFYKEAVYAGYSIEYIQKHLKEKWSSIDTEQAIEDGKAYIVEYRKQMWDNFDKTNPNYESRTNT